MKEEIIAPIERLLDREEKLASLCGEVLATVRLNLDRGHITFRHDDNTVEVFRRWLEQWEEQYRGICG